MNNTTHPTGNLIATLAAENNMTQDELVEGIKEQCFGALAPKIQPHHLMTFCHICKKLNLDPLKSNQLYAFPTKTGQLQIIISIDAICAVLYARSDVKHFETKPIFSNDGKLIAAEASILTTKSDMPFKYTAFLREWQMSSSPVWQSKPIHMLTLRALKQCARYIDNSIPMDGDEITMADSTSAPVEVVADVSDAAASVSPLAKALARMKEKTEATTTKKQSSEPKTADTEQPQDTQQLQDRKAGLATEWSFVSGVGLEVLDKRIINRLKTDFARYRDDGERSPIAYIIAIRDMQKDISDWLERNGIHVTEASVNEIIDDYACKNDGVAMDRDIAYIVAAVQQGWAF